MHAVDRANQTGQAKPSDWAIMIYHDNVITSKAVAANVAGTSYRVNCELSTAVYNGSSQATQAGDALRPPGIRRCRGGPAPAPLAPPERRGTGEGRRDEDGALV